MSLVEIRPKMTRGLKFRIKRDILLSIVKVSNRGKRNDDIAYPGAMLIPL